MLGLKLNRVIKRSPSHIVSWRLENNFQWILNQNAIILQKKMILKLSSGKWWPFGWGYSFKSRHSLVYSIRLHMISTQLIAVVTRDFCWDQSISAFAVSWIDHLDYPGYGIFEHITNNLRIYLNHQMCSLIYHCIDNIEQLANWRNVAKGKQREWQTNQHT